MSSIRGIKLAKKKVLIAKNKNERGDIITSRKEIANVFSELYKKLYDDNEQDECGNESNTDVHINDPKKRREYKRSRGANSFCLMFPNICLTISFVSSSQALMSSARILSQSSNGYLLSFLIASCNSSKTGRK